MWIKICGVRDVATASAVAQAGANAIGLNFYRHSRRFVDPATAARIVAGLPREVEAVGVFVNAAAEEIEAAIETCGLRTIQLHGDEPPELLSHFQSCRVIRAFRVGESGLGPLDRELEALAAANVSVEAALVDAHAEGEYGGTGRVAPWDLLSREWPRKPRPKWILAGGLTPENVARAVQTCRPWGLDVASGVESGPGVKDLTLVRRFIENARAVS